MGVGYSKVLDHFAAKQGLTETTDLIKTRTRRFAKRQGTWFRGLEECRFVDLLPDDTAVGIVERIVVAAEQDS